MLKKVLIVLIILLIIVGGLFMFEPLFMNNKLKKANLISVKHSCGGSMTGGYSSAELVKKEDGVKYITQKSNYHNEQIVTKTYNAKEEDLELIKELAIKYNMYKISKRPKSKIEVLDGETCSLSFYFDDYDSFVISSYQDLTSTQSKYCQEIINTLNTFAIGEPTIEIEKHEISLVIDGYQIGYHLEHSNAADTFIEIVDKYNFVDYENVGKACILNEELDIEGLELINNLNKGDLVYDKENNQLIFLYDDLNTNNNYYLLGEINDMYESSFDLIKKMEDKEYYINMWK